MPTESTFILASIFLILAATGWLLGYFGERDEQPPLNIDYLKGLNFLLNDQTDQAVEHFLKMVRVDNTTIETHFALGNLFRKRGEVNRAIRIHQNIIARPDISNQQRDQAFNSLAKDYLHAGLLDRAEVLFIRLSDDSDYSQEAFLNLISIYEQEKEWEKAIEASQKLSKLSNKDSYQHQISHYSCELAEEAISIENFKEASSQISRIKVNDQTTLRIDLIKANIAFIKHDLKIASEIYYKILNKSSYLITESLPLLFDIYKKQDELSDLDLKLSLILKSHPNIRNDIAYTAILNDIRGSVVINECIEKYIQDDRALSEFINVNDIFQSDLSIRIDAIDKIRYGLKVLGTTNPRYQCNECGFSSQKLLWLCPSCKDWETQRPFLSVKFDSLLQRKAISS
jgi:lipopolysaccharide biosynthesis regulator YciM|tara:strand:- start:7164 stop:8360 length:1197 start_codon:yes stop_codon:yes gene_type:complete